MLSIFPFVGHLYVFFGEMSIQSFAHFKNRVIWYFWYWAVEIFYILDINPLSHIWYTILFPHSVGYLFILLSVSFAIQLCVLM